MVEVGSEIGSCAEREVMGMGMGRGGGGRKEEDELETRHKTVPAVFQRKGRRIMSKTTAAY